MYTVLFGTCLCAFDVCLWYFTYALIKNGFINLIVLYNVRHPYVSISRVRILLCISPPLGHVIPDGLHDKHHNRLQEYDQSFRWDELRGSTAMILAHVISPLRINTFVYYSYMWALLSIHRACHYEGVHLLNFHPAYHNEHHNNPNVNFAIVTPLMDLLLARVSYRSPQKRNGLNHLSNIMNVGFHHLEWFFFALVSSPRSLTIDSILCN